MEVDERGDAFRGIPKLCLFSFLRFTLGCLGHPQAQALATPYSIIHQIFTQKLENFSTQNSTENTSAPLANENKTPLQGTVMNSLFIYIGVKPTVFQLLYGLYPRYQPQIHQNKQTTHVKQNLSKTEQSVVICSQRKIWNPKNSKINCWTGICLLIIFKKN